MRIILNFHHAPYRWEAHGSVMKILQTPHPPSTSPHPSSASPHLSTLSPHKDTQPTNHAHSMTYHTLHIMPYYTPYTFYPPIQFYPAHSVQYTHHAAPYQHNTQEPLATAPPQTPPHDSIQIANTAQTRTDLLSRKPLHTPN